MRFRGKKLTKGKLPLEKDSCGNCGDHGVGGAPPKAGIFIRDVFERTDHGDYDQGNDQAIFNSRGSARVAQDVVKESAFTHFNIPLLRKSGGGMRDQV